MIPENFKLLSAQFWLGGVLLGVVDVAFVALLTWRVKPARFRELKWTLAGTAAVFWGIFTSAVVWVFWDIYYRYFLPGWLRSGGLLLFVPILFGVFALAFHGLALRGPGNPIVTFGLLGGLESWLEHLWGIYGLKILDIPFLQEASPASILAFAFPEYILYWCIVIGLAVLFQRGWRWWSDRRRTRARAA